MEVSEIIAKIGEKQSRLQASKKQNYLKLVDAVASGNAEVDTEASAEILDAAGKSSVDLATDVEKVRKRMAIKESVKELSTIEAKIEKNKKAIEKQARQLREAEELHDSIVEPLANENIELASKLSQIRGDALSYPRLYPDAELVESLDSKVRQLDHLRGNLKQLERWRQESVIQQMSILEKEISDIKAIIEA